MVRITKNEKEYLQSKGYNFPDMLHRTYSKYKTYYATEDKKLMNDLNNYRESRVLGTYAK